MLLIIIYDNDEEEEQKKKQDRTKRMFYFFRKRAKELSRVGESKISDGLPSIAKFNVPEEYVAGERQRIATLREA